ASWVSPAMCSRASASPTSPSSESPRGPSATRAASDSSCRDASPSAWSRRTPCSISSSGCATRRTASPSAPTAPSDRSRSRSRRSTRSPASGRDASAHCCCTSAPPAPSPAPAWRICRRSRASARRWRGGFTSTSIRRDRWIECARPRNHGRRRIMLTDFPNLLTLSRIIIIPVLVGLFYLDDVAWRWVSVALFSLAGVTDYFDGYFARRWAQISAFGRFLDPIADKLLVAAVILMLVARGRIAGLVVLPALVILCREVMVSGLREFLAQVNVGVPVSRLAKWKTALQLVALGVLIVGDAAGPW